MVRDPIAQLDLPEPAFPEVGVEPAPPVAAPEFPPEASAVTDEPNGFAERTKDGVFPPPGSQPESARSPSADPSAVLEQALAQLAPVQLSAIEKYRLENDRELLRKIAYQRMFVNGGVETMSADLIVDDGVTPVTFAAAVNPGSAGQYVAAAHWTEVSSDAWSFYDYPGRDGVFAKFLGARRNRLTFQIYLVGATQAAVRTQWQAWQTAWRGKPLTITPPDDAPRVNCIKRAMTSKPREYCPAGVMLRAVLEFEETGG